MGKLTELVDRRWWIKTILTSGSFKWDDARGTRSMDYRAACWKVVQRIYAYLSIRKASASVALSDLNWSFADWRHRRYWNSLSGLSSWRNYKRWCTDIVTERGRAVGPGTLWPKERLCQPRSTRGGWTEADAGSQWYLSGRDQGSIYRNPVSLAAV